MVIRKPYPGREGRREWDFEKYASVILYLNTYYENFMSPAEKLKMTDAYSEEYCRVPVSEELLKKMDYLCQ